MYEIDPRTSIGAVALTVSNLARSLGFYRERLGFRIHRQQAQTAHLGAGGQDLLILTEDQHATRPPAQSTGLYHFAVLVPSRRHLAQSLHRMIETQTRLQGFADHLVSEAIYLADPDGNGIEIYRDRPREEWPWLNGMLQMGTEPLDIEGLSQELAGDPMPWSGLAAGTTIGHIHLKVNRIRESEQFYQDLLGFSLVQRYGPAATFLSAGGYHHHIGANTWSGQGAPPPPPGSLGLRWFEIVLPDAASLAMLAERIAKSGIPTQPYEGGIRLSDPADNGIVLRAGTATGS